MPERWLARPPGPYTLLPFGGGIRRCLGAELRGDSRCTSSSARRVGGARERLGSPHLGLRGLLLLLFLVALVASALRLADLETDRLELALERLGLVVVELVLEDERLQLGGLDEAPLLGTLDQRSDLLRLEEFDQLVLRQLVTQSFRCLVAQLCNYLYAV